MRIVSPSPSTVMSFFSRFTTVVILGILTAASVSAQTTTAFKTGEEMTGMTKQCYYDALGSGVTRTISSVALCPLSIQVQLGPRTPSQPEAPRTPAPATVTAFNTGERVTGMTKQCFYEALGNAYTKTIGSVELCPLSLKVRSGPYD